MKLWRTKGVERNLPLNEATFFIVYKRYQMIAYAKKKIPSLDHTTNRYIYVSFNHIICPNNTLLHLVPYYNNATI